MSYVNRIAAAYRLTHKPSGCFYIGSSGHYKVRLGQHKSKLSTGTHANKRLQSVFTNWDDVAVEIFEVLDRHEALELEQRLLDEHYHSDLCCNVAMSNSDPTQGVITDDMRRTNALKAAAAWRGSKMSEESRVRMSISATGVPVDEDTKLKISRTKSRRVSVNGVEYESAYALAKELGIPVRTVRTRIYSDSQSFKDWLFI